MRGLDDTDREILRLLLEDSRRPYSEIASTVGLSGPAVSDRVDRLVELGVVQRFTADIDRSLLRQEGPVLVTVRATPGAGPAVRDALAGTSAVEHLFLTADDRVVCTALAENPGELLAETLPADVVREYSVRPVRDSSWTPRVGHAELAPDCAECDNTVGPEGERERVDGEWKQFCCSSCRDAFLERYEQFDERA